MKVVDVKPGAMYTIREDRVFVKRRCFARNWLAVQRRDDPKPTGHSSGARDLRVFDGRVCLHIRAGEPGKTVHYMLVDDEVLPVLGGYWRSIEEVVNETR